jgi:transposase
MAYSMDLRVRVLEDCDLGMRTREVAKKYRVSPAWIRRLKQRRRESGEIEPRPPGHRPSTSAAHAEAIRDLIRSRPDLTLADIKAELNLAQSLTTIWRVIRALGLTLKKKSSAHPSRTGPTSRNGDDSGGPINPRSTRDA